METTNVMMKFILTTIVFLALAISGVAQTRNVIVNTNGVIQSPTNFWSADVTNARAGLGLGSAATNPASAFQPSSVALSNLAAGNGGSLTNITATIVGTNVAISNVVGLQSALDGKLATNGNTTGTASNVTGVVSLANGGTGGTNATSARTSLGATTVGANIFTLSNPDEIKFLRLNANSSVSALTAADFRTAIGASTGLGTVTSVGLTVPNIFSLTGSPITSNGTFAITLQTQSSRNFLAAPNLGGVPSFRAIDSDDLPSLAILKVTGLQTALDGKLATNGTATLANNVTGIVALANGGTGGSNAATGRTGLGATTVGSSLFTLVNPSDIRFLRVNNDNTVSALSGSDFRTAIGLGTAATNPASAFQPSSLALSNLASSNGGALTNLTAANITGIVSISNGGSSATTVGGARTNLGLGATNDVQFNTVNTRGIFDGTNEIIDVENNWLNYIGFGATFEWGDTANTTYVPFAFGGTNAALNASTTRTNLGGTTVGNSVFTATNAAAAATAVGLGTTNDVTFGSVRSSGLFVSIGTNEYFYAADDMVKVSVPMTIYGTYGISFATNVAAAQTRTNLGLGWSALTNTNTAGFNTSLYGSGTNPVLYNTNGEVVSPTNFWQNVPSGLFANAFQNLNLDNFSVTNNATNVANLLVYSIASNVGNITNTINLPTNGSSGNIATIVHTGPTNSVTAIRKTGGTNLITLNKTGESVRFVYDGTNWSFVTALSFTEPVFFVGTNATANAAASRTNLGLGITNLVQFAYVESPYFFVGDGTNGIDFETDAVAAITRTNLGIGSGATNTVSFGKIRVPTGNFTIEDPVNDASIITFPTDTDPVVLGADYWDHASVRTSLGLGATNDVTFSSLTLSSDLTFGSGDNIVLSTTTGTKIGTATNQLIGFYNQTPITQPSSTGVTTNGFTTGGGTAVHANSTFTGGIGTNAYTISDVVAHLKSLGLLAP
jgi:hypothetical protein